MALMSYWGLMRELAKRKGPVDRTFSEVWTLFLSNKEKLHDDVNRQ